MSCIGCPVAVDGKPPANVRLCDFAEPKRLVDMKEDADACPVRDINTVRWLLRLGSYMPSTMLVAGGSLDQPALLLDAVEIAKGAIDGD